MCGKGLHYTWCRYWCCFFYFILLLNFNEYFVFYFTIIFFLSFFPSFFLVLYVVVLRLNNTRRYSASIARSPRARDAFIKKTKNKKKMYDGSQNFTSWTDNFFLLSGTPLDITHAEYDKTFSRVSTAIQIILNAFFSQ